MDKLVLCITVDPKRDVDVMIVDDPDIGQVIQLLKGTGEQIEWPVNVWEKLKCWIDLQLRDNI